MTIMISGKVKTVNLPERFLAKFIETPLGCWEWQGSFINTGYGCLKIGGRKGKNTLAHRFAYETLIGKIPKGLEIDHLCRNTKCVNPEHLEAVTRRVNSLRGLAPIVNGRNELEKTHCPYGHPYDKENTYYRPDTNHRVCKLCSRERQRNRTKEELERIRANCRRYHQSPKGKKTRELRRLLLNAKGN